MRDKSSRSVLNHLSIIFKQSWKHLVITNIVTFYWQHLIYLLRNLGLNTISVQIPFYYLRFFLSLDLLKYHFFSLRKIYQNTGNPYFPQNIPEQQNSSLFYRKIHQNTRIYPYFTAKYTRIPEFILILPQNIPEYRNLQNTENAGNVRNIGMDWWTMLGIYIMLDNNLP